MVRGMLYNEYQHKILSKKQESMKVNNGWGWDDPEYVAQWKYENTLLGCDIAIDIAPEFGLTSEFQGTLGHKINHKFDPNARFIAYESARFGLINAIKTSYPIKKDEEFFASYGYQLTRSPKWYRDLYRQFAKANPEVIRTIDEFESGLTEATTHDDAEGFGTPIMGGIEDIEKDDAIVDLEINSP